MAKDITNLVDTPPDFQARARVRLTGVYASVSKSGGDYELTVNGEITPIKGDQLENDLILAAIAYDDKSRVIGKSEEHIEAAEFFRFAVFSIDMYIPAAPAKVCLLPRNSISSNSTISIELD